jgi:hypothetical protein
VDGSIRENIDFELLEKEKCCGGGLMLYVQEEWGVY